LFAKTRKIDIEMYKTRQWKVALFAGFVFVTVSTTTESAPAAGEHDGWVHVVQADKGVFSVFLNSKKNLIYFYL
jgi:hypothetical protein